MKRLTTLLTMAITFTGLGQEYTLSVESSAPVNPNLGTVYRVYINANAPTDKFSALYGWEGQPFQVQTPEGVFNSPYNESPTASGLESSMFAVWPEVANDSFLTIGLSVSAEEAGFEGQDPVLSGCNYEEGLVSDYFMVNGAEELDVNTQCGMSVYVLDSWATALPSNGRWLIMQLTTTGDVAGRVQCQIFPNGIPGDNTVQMDLSFCGVGEFGENSQLLPGCTDALACNYDANAQCWGGGCVYAGCTNPTAQNYNSDAGCDDGSCIVLGCADVLACNFLEAATQDDGSCDFASCYGCNDAQACNYDESATFNDGSCDFESCYGCTFPYANNYLPEALFDDGSCVVHDFPTNILLSDSTICPGQQTFITTRPPKSLDAFSWSFSNWPPWQPSTTFWLDSPSSAMLIASGTFSANWIEAYEYVDAAYRYSPSIGAKNVLTLNGTNVRPSPDVYNSSHVYCFKDLNQGQNTLSKNQIGSSYDSGTLSFTVIDTLHADYAFSQTVPLDILDTLTWFATWSTGVVGDTLIFEPEVSQWISVNLSNELFSVQDSVFLEVYTIEGCTDPNATNFNTFATCDDGSCNVVGCTNPEACNFDVTATEQGFCDFSCVPRDVTFQLDNSSLGLEFAALYLPDLPATDSVGFLLEMELFDSVYSTTVELLPGEYFFSFWGELDQGLQSELDQAFPQDTFEGFMDCRTLIVGADSNTPIVLSPLCWMSCAGCAETGCTNSSAVNFNPGGTWDDGSCVLPSCDEIGNSIWDGEPLGIVGAGLVEAIELFNVVSDNFLVNVPSQVSEGGNTFSINTASFSVDTDIESAQIEMSEFIIAGQQGCLSVNFVADTIGEFSVVLGIVPQIEVLGTTISLDTTHQTLSWVVDLPTEELLGCTYEEALNFDWFASQDNGQCVFDECDITLDNEAVFSAGVESVDITIDNQEVYDSAFLDGVASVECPEPQASSCPSDLNSDGHTGSSDLLIFLSEYGEDCD